MAGMIIVRLARRFPVTVAAWIFAILFWSDADLRWGLLASGAAWVPLQLLFTGVVQSLQNRTGPIQWPMVAAQFLIAGAVAYICIQGDMAFSPGEHPRVFDALLLGVLAAYGATRLVASMEHGGAPGARGPRQPPAAPSR